jgi:hypothetical protein
MFKEPRRRMSRHARLVLLGGVPALLGCGGLCGGCGGTTTTETAASDESMEPVEEMTEDPPPAGPAHMTGAPFIAWWAATHPPIVTYRMVPRAAIVGGGYARTGGGFYRRTYSYTGRSGYLSTGPSRPIGAVGVVHGGFGGTGHAASGGS